MAGRFATTLFLSATLLFACQPMIARMTLPLLGGAPAVWIVCSLCFQALLLAGYCWAHVTGTRLRLKTQIVLQLLVIGCVFLVLPFHVDENQAGALLERWPTAGLILILLRTVGLPFFVLATTSPLLQRWFSELGETDPYHLYAASNAGSMLALLGYPFFVERFIPLASQTRIFHGAYVLYAVAVTVCAMTLMRRHGTRRIEATPAPAAVQASASYVPDAPPTSARDPWVERAIWVGLAFAPSSLLLGATEYVTTDLASVPLLWVVPLALYLASFIVAFAKKRVVSDIVLSRVMALVVALVAAMMLAQVARPAWLIVGGHFLLLFVASVVCHVGLADRRPPVARLTEFYLLLSLGGVLGGLWNGVVAPFVFRDLFEYPLAIGFACLGRAALAPKRATVDEDGDEIPGDPPIVLGRDVAWGSALGVVGYALVKVGARMGVDPLHSFGWMFGIPILVAFAWSRRPVRYAFAVGGLLLAGMTHGGFVGQSLYVTRNFFGVLKVTRASDGRFQHLVYGHTMHGKQSTDPELRKLPLAYFHPAGPAGEVLGPIQPPPPPASEFPSQRHGRRVGVIGLGIGSLAAYCRPGDAWTFFELNPAVVVMAREHFSYLSSVPKDATLDVEVGDARLSLKNGPADRFDVLVLDAFSSDAIPVHLVTREALAVYRRAMRPDGLLFAHISNDHVALAPVFAALAKDAGLDGIEQHDLSLTPEQEAVGKSASEWVVLSKSKAELRRISEINLGWAPLGPATKPVWTDDFANVLGAIRL